MACVAYERGQCDEELIEVGEMLFEDGLLFCVNFTKFLLENTKII